MSPAFNIYKKTNITLVLVKKNSNMELWSLLSLNCLSLSSSEEADKTASSSHKQATKSQRFLEWSKKSSIFSIQHWIKISLMKNTHYF